MNRYLRLFVWISPVVLTILLLFGTNIWSQVAGQKPVKVGIVDLSKVFDGYAKLKDYQGSIAALKDKETQTMDILKNRMENLNTELKDLEEALKKDFLNLDLKLKYRDRAAEGASLKAQYEYRYKSWNELIDKEYVRKVAEFYSSICDSIEKYGLANEFDIILKYDPSDIITKDEYTDEKMTRRILLYHSKSLDVTQGVIDELNKK